MTSVTQQIETLLRSSVWILIPATVVYGIYVVLFVQCIRILWERKRAGYKWQIGSISILYVLATIFLFMTSYSMTILGPPSAITVVKNYVLIAMFTVSDMILIYRCYLVWGNKIVVTLVPAFLLACTLSTMVLTPFVHISSAYLTIAFYALGTVTNILVTSLTVGRIWWIYRISKDFLASKIQEQYIRSLNLILESGLIILVLQVTRMINIAVILHGKMGFTIGASKDNDFVIADSSIAMLQAILTALLPTLMLLRVAWGYDSVDTLRQVNRIHIKTALA